MITPTRLKRSAMFALVLAALIPVGAAAPSHVDITWMSISNIYYELRHRARAHRRLHHARAAERVLWRRGRPRADAPGLQAGRRGRHARAVGARRPVERQRCCLPATVTSITPSIRRRGRGSRARVSSDRRPRACRRRRRSCRPSRCTHGRWRRKDRAGRWRHDARRPLESQRRPGDQSRAAQRRRARRGASAPIHRPAACTPALPRTFPTAAGTARSCSSSTVPEGRSAGSFRTPPAPSICTFPSSSTA